MSTSDEEHGTQIRNPDCRATMRGVVPWACHVVHAMCQVDNAVSTSTSRDAYLNGAWKLLEDLHPLCIECAREKLANRVAPA